jgi:hypothetical protein
MQECQEKARDLVKPGYENDPNQISKVEQALISCMSKQVNEHIKLLKPMKDRYVSATWNLFPGFLFYFDVINFRTNNSIVYIHVD